MMKPDSHSGRLRACAGQVIRDWDLWGAALSTGQRRGLYDGEGYEELDDDRVEEVDEEGADEGEIFFL